MRIPAFAISGGCATSFETCACPSNLGFARILSIGLTRSQAARGRGHQEAVSDESGSGICPCQHLDVRLKDFCRPCKTANSTPLGANCHDDCIAQSHEARHPPAITCFGIKSAVSAIAVPYLVL